MRSILSVVMLCASMGAILDVEAKGDDALDAVRAVELEFRLEGGGGPERAVTRL